MKTNYKITLAYDGTRYLGWQKQSGQTEGKTGDKANDQSNDKTIQGKLETILKKLSGTEVQVNGSGRTDAGVHAKAQIANFHLDTELTLNQLKGYLNQYLPEDIGVIDITIAADRFHSRLNAREKTYCYRLYMGPNKPVFDRRYVCELEQIRNNLSLDPNVTLDLKAMEEAVKYMTGTQDYAAFCANKRMKKSTVRFVRSIKIDLISAEELDITITGNGFLHHMVRIMVGTLLEVGLGLREATMIPQIIAGKRREAAGHLVPAKGLTLVQVEY